MKRRFTALMLSLLIICMACLPVVSYADAEESASQCAYTVKVYYDFHCDEEQTYTAYFDKGHFIEDEDVLQYFLNCYCDFCKKRVDAHDKDRVYCPECYRNGCNQYVFLKTLGTEILADEDGGAIHVYFVSHVLKVHAYRFYGNRTDNENAINNAHATYKHIAAEGILYTSIMLVLTYVAIIHSWGYVADYKEARRKREEMDQRIMDDQRAEFAEDAAKFSEQQKADADAMLTEFAQQTEQ